jgi:hypothetical protein
MLSKPSTSDRSDSPRRVMDTTPEDRILILVQALESRSDEVKVKRNGGNPIIFEVKVAEVDYLKISDVQLAIESFVRSLPDMQGKLFQLQLVPVK